MKQTIKYVSHFEAGNESVDVEINGKIRLKAKKVEAFTPHWKLTTVSGLKLGTIYTLADLTNAIKSGNVEREIATVEYNHKIKRG